jgi:iron complex outermembrane receptor protein
MMGIGIGRGALAAVSLLAIAAPGYAQSEAPPEEETTGLADIVVMAQKRSENIQKVPIAISAISGEALGEQGIRNVNSIVGQVPSMAITTPYGDAIPTFSLRGISAVDYSQNQSGPIALYVDEVYKGPPALTSMQIFDVDRIEVLRGPQGTLYGKNTTGGAVNIYTRQPDLNDGFSGNLTLGYGRFNRRTANGGANIPIVTDTIAARLAFTATKARGFVKNRLPGNADQGGIDDWAVRASVAIRPADNLDVTLRYTRSKSSPSGYGPIADGIGAGGIGLPGTPDLQTGYTRDGLGFFENESDRTGRLRVRNQSAAARINWSISDSVDFTSLTSFDKGSFVAEEDADGSPFNILHLDYQSEAKAFSQDLRLASAGSGPLTWLVGAYYNRDRIRSYQIYRYFYEFAGSVTGDPEADCLNSFLIGCRAENDFQQVRKSFAGYAQGTYRFDNGLSITAGLRYTKDDNRLDYYHANLGYVDPASGQEVAGSLVTISAPPVSRLRNHNFSGKIGAAYEFSSGTLAYANFSRGYRGGSFNGVAFFDPSEVTVAKPEKLDAYEVGLKTQAFDRRLRLNIAGFHYSYINQQFIDITPSFLQILYNAPRSTLWGGEVEVLVRPVEPLTLRLGGSYLNAKFKEIELSGIDLSGNRMLLAPKWTLAGGLDWSIVDGSAGSLKLHTDSRYSSKFYFEAFNVSGLEQKSYWVHDARLTFTTANKAVAVSGWVRNLANEKYRVYRSNLAGTFNYNYGQRGRPREYGVELTYQF